MLYRSTLPHKTHAGGCREVSWRTLRRRRRARHGNWVCGGAEIRKQLDIYRKRPVWGLNAGGRNEINLRLSPAPAQRRWPVLPSRRAPTATDQSVQRAYVAYGVRPEHCASWRFVPRLAPHRVRHALNDRAPRRARRESARAPRRSGSCLGLHTVAALAAGRRRRRLRRAVGRLRHGAGSERRSSRPASALAFTSLGERVLIFGLVALTGDGLPSVAARVLRGHEQQGELACLHSRLGA